MCKPRNLTIIIMDNGLYQITGKQPTATAGVTDIVAVARGAGIANSHWVRDEAHFDALLDRRFDDGGPVLLAVQDRRQTGRRAAAARPAAGPQSLHERPRHRARRRAGLMVRVQARALGIVRSRIFSSPMGSFG